MEINQLNDQMAAKVDKALAALMDFDPADDDGWLLVYLAVHAPVSTLRGLLIVKALKHGGGLKLEPRSPGGGWRYAAKAVDWNAKDR